MTQPVPIQWLAHWRPEDRLERSSPYAYACGGCSRCCRHKVITVNPYEVARLARNQGMSTTRFLSEHMNGVALNRREDGTCVFLNEQGCSVHPDRPLVCRLYPLGRHVGLAGAETFSHLEPHAETIGRYSEEGTVQSWLDAQGAGPFIDATDAYLAVFHRVFAKLEAQEGGSSGEGVADWPDGGDGRQVDWLDIDGAIGERDDTETPEQRMQKHIRWLDEREV